MATNFQFIGKPTIQAVAKCIGRDGYREFFFDMGGNSVEICESGIRVQSSVLGKTVMSSRNLLLILTLLVKSPKEMVTID